MAVTLLPALLCLVVHITESNAGIVTSPGLQRKSVGQTCTFQWAVNDPIVSYSLYNWTTGAQRPLSRGSYTSANGVITLTIVNVQLWDAGNYSVTVTTNKTMYSDTNACLFVYGNLQASVAITVGTNSPKEGDTVELACNLTSNSLPVAYRTDIYYTWGNKYGRFQNISNGTAVYLNGNPLPGYTVKNNGRTLHISSVQYPDDYSVYCYGSEDVLNNGWSSFYFPIPLRYRPYISSLNPTSKKFNAFVSSTVALSFSVRCNPPITSITNWTFVNSAGISKDLPPDSVESGLFLYVYDLRPSLQFNFTSEAFYGTYSINMTNELGSTTTAFQVLPQSRPDAPSNLALYYFSHNFVYILWNLMSSNVFTRQQTVITRLTQSGNDKEIQTCNNTYYDGFNFTFSCTFGSNIQPLTNYKISVWSTNSLGSSEVVELKFRTRSQPRLTVLPEMITINGTQAIVNFTVEMGENTESIVSVQAQCCSRFSALCVSNSSLYTVNQIVLSNIPNGTEYFVDVTINSGIYGKYSYYSDTLKGVRVSRNGNSDSSECKVNQRLLVGVIVLASLLGVAVVVAFAILSVYLVKRSRRERRQPTKPPPIPTITYLDKKQNAMARERPQSNGSDVYEPVA